MELKSNEKIEDLECNGLKIIQSNNGFKFGTDAVILADFAKKHVDNKNVLDIGTGTGIISILLAGKTNVKKIVGVDIQKDVCDMAQRSVELNKLENKIEIINIDIKDIDKIIEKHTIDIIVTNPPYQKESTGKTGKNEAEFISRHEIKCNFEDICKSAKYVLRPKGEMYIIHRPERLVDIICSLRDNGIEPKEIKFVEPHLGKKPNMVMIKAVKGGRPFLRLLDSLVMYEDNGNYTRDLLKIYGK